MSRDPIVALKAIDAVVEVSQSMLERGNLPLEEVLEIQDDIEQLTEMRPRVLGAAQAEAARQRHSEALERAVLAELRLGSLFRGYTLPRRSQLDANDKAFLIRELGGENYRRLPW